MASAAEQRWLPLESNPGSMNAWAHSLGLDTSQYSFQDVFALDDELLSWVQQPCKAVLMLFPITDAFERERRATDERTLEHGMPGVAGRIFFRQRIRNACGTFALLHALANAQGLPIQPGVLTDLFEQAKDKDPSERAELLETSGELASAHTSSATTGNQTATPDLADEVDLHFVAFVESPEGNLIEYDGNRLSPVNHGHVSEHGDFLRAAVAHVRKIIELTGSDQFSVIALGPTPKE